MTNTPPFPLAIVIALYNRPDEIRELLESLVKQNRSDFWTVIVEDGSSIRSESICLEYQERLHILYLEKENGGPSSARNYGVAHLPEGCEWVLFVDSDCTLPHRYIERSQAFASFHPDVDLYGGPDAAHESFTRIQKAISYSMTSVLSTGGIRGGAIRPEKFHPRTFNMTVRLAAFQKVGGFDASMRYGEDVDFSLRVRATGSRSMLVPNLYVYHKRRTDFRAFFWQVFHSGRARWALRRRHPGSMKLVHWLPALAILGAGALLIAGMVHNELLWLLIALLALYVLLIVPHALYTARSPWVALLALCACFVQTIGYGLGFLRGIFDRR